MMLQMGEEGDSHELRDRRDGGRVIATRRHFWRHLGRAIDRPRIDMAGEAVTAMIVADDAGDNPLADRREDREAAAARERKAKVAKLNSQTANAMEVVRTQQAAKERGAFDEAALTANEVAGAPVKGTSAMVKSIFDSRRDGKDWKMVQRREQRKTQTGAGTGAQVMEGLEKVAASAIEMYQKGGTDALTVTDAHAVLVNDVALKQGMLAISAKAVSNYPQFVSWLATFATFVQCFYPSCGWRHNLPLDGSGGKPILPSRRSWWCSTWRWLPTAWLVPMGGFVCDFEDGSASFAARGGRVPHSKSRPLGGKDNFTMKTISLFLDGLSGWSRAHNVLAPQDDQEWKVMIKAMRKVCNVRLDSNRPYKAAALCPVTVAALMSTLSVTNAGDVTFAAVLALGLAFWMRPNEWFFLDVECLAFVEMQGIELLHILFVISKADEFSSGVVRIPTQIQIDPQNS